MPDVFVSDEPAEKSQIIPNKVQRIMNGQSKLLPYFASYCKLPEGISFENQEANEVVIIFLRRHFITNARWISIGIFLLLIPLFIFSLASLVAINLFLPFNYLFIVTLFYYMIVIGYIFNNFITWFYNFGIITTEQIIDLDFNDIMYRTVAKARIQDVVDVEFEQGGFLHSFFDYGNVFIQTEGVKPNFEFQAVPFPDKVTDVILDLKQKATT